MSGRFRPSEGSREGLSSGFVSAGLPITVCWEAEPQRLLKNEKQIFFQLNLLHVYSLDSFKRIADHQIPLSLPVIFCPTAAAVASQGNKPRRALLCNSRLRNNPVVAFHIGWRIAA